MTVSGLDGSPGRGIEVVLARRDVVGRVGMVEGREELDVAATEAELPLPAAVGADAVRLAVVVGREEPLD